MMALLSALFFGALNRFGEQIHNETNIKNELNEWFVVRSNLWRELDEADSIRVSDNIAQLFLPGKTIQYSIHEDRLFRKTDETETTDLHIPMNSIATEDRNGHTYVSFNVSWKDEEMALKFPIRSGVAHNVNHYFSQQLWQQ